MSISAPPRAPGGEAALGEGEEGEGSRNAPRAPAMPSGAPAGDPVRAQARPGNAGQGPPAHKAVGGNKGPKPEPRAAKPELVEDNS